MSIICRGALALLPVFLISVSSIFFWVPTALAQKPQVQPPVLTCSLPGLVEPAPANYEATNLEKLFLQINLLPSGLNVEELFDAPEAITRNKGEDPTLEISVTWLDGERTGRPVRIEPTPSLRGVRRVIWIPVAFDQIWQNFSRYFDRISTRDTPENVNNRELIERGRQNLGTLFGGVVNSVYENEPGGYQIDCTYRSSKTGFWNGEIRAEPIFVNITFKEAFYDQDRFIPPEDASK
ncbi:MAG: hypothetical protein HKN28_06865 [Alphaproteobacteria bacterium]|nr:hypothetical protein [Alphaproteobacteria bacterium]